MNIIEKIQSKTRDEYLAMAKLYVARLSGMIQQKPLEFFAGGVLAGMLIIALRGILIPLLIVAACVAVTIYFIAPVRKI